MIESSFTWKVGYIILGCIQNMTMGGIIYGWSSISSLLVSNPSDGGPGLSNEFVHTMFVVASFCSFLGPLFLGFILDSYGPRICSAISILFIISGCLLIGFSETGESVSLLVAISLIGFGGPGVQSAIIHLSNLFPVWKASATAIITGSFQLSFFIFYIFDRLWSTQNWDYKNIFLTYMGLCTINIMASIFVWPDKPFSFDPPIVFESDDQLSSLSNASFHKKRRKRKPLKLGLIRAPSVLVHPHVSPPQLEDEYDDDNLLTEDDLEEDDLDLHYERHHGRSHHHHHHHDTDIKSQSLYKQMTSVVFLELVVYFVIASFWANFYIGTMDMQLGDTLHLEGEALEVAGRQCTIIMTLGAIVIPAIGFTMDYFGFPATSLISTFFGICWSFLVLNGGTEYLVLSFVCYTLFRTFLFTFTFAYLADVLGFDYFGMLAGLLFIAGGIVSILQYSVRRNVMGTCHLYSNDDCDEGLWNLVNLLMLISFLLLPLFSYRDYNRRKQMDASKANNTKNLNLNSDESNFFSKILLYLRASKNNENDNLYYSQLERNYQAIE